MLYIVAQSYIFKDLDYQKMDLFFYYSNTYLSCLCLVFMNIYVVESISLWMFWTGAEWQSLSMHRCVGTAHTQICYDVYTVSMWKAPKFVWFGIFVIFRILHTRMSKLEEWATFAFVYDWVSYSHKFATWSGKLPQTRSLAWLQCTDGVDVLLGAACHTEESAFGAHVEETYVRDNSENGRSNGQNLDMCFLPYARHFRHHYHHGSSSDLHKCLTRNGGLLEGVKVVAKIWD